VRCEVREISWRDELDVMPYSEEDSIFISLMLHGGNGACDYARLEDLGFEDSNCKMDMQISESSA